MKIGTKLMVIITAVNLIGIGGLTVSSAVSSSSQLIKVSEGYGNSIASDTAKEIRLYLEIPLDEIRAIANIGDYLNTYTLERRRPMINFLLESLCKSNPSFVGVWAGFQPNALDGMDAAFANTPGTDATGRFG